jgi:hypothetical protein
MNARKTTWLPSLVLTCGLKVRTQQDTRSLSLQQTALIDLTAQLIQQLNRLF